MKEDFYYKLNQSHKNLDNREYIKITTDFMSSSLKEQTKKERLLVVGSGNLSDFNLDYFLLNFKEVHLSDIDIESIKYALKEQNDNSRIIIHQVDYIGFTESHFFDNFHDLLKMVDYQEVKTFFIEKFKILEKYHFSSKFSQLFDVIYISPIYTQLLYRQIEVDLDGLVKLGFSREYKDQIITEILQMMIELIDNFNQEVVKLLIDEGTVFVGSDIFYLDENAFSNEIRNNIANHDKTEKLYKGYQNQYGFGIGDYGLYSLSQKLELKKEKWVLWGNYHKNAYAVKFCDMKKILKI